MAKARAGNNRKDSARRPAAPSRMIAPTLTGVVLRGSLRPLPHLLAVVREVPAPQFLRIGPGRSMRRHGGGNLPGLRPQEQTGTSTSKTCPRWPAMAGAAFVLRPSTARPAGSLWASIRRGPAPVASGDAARAAPNTITRLPTGHPTGVAAERAPVRLRSKDQGKRHGDGRIEDVLQGDRPHSGKAPAKSVPRHARTRDSHLPQTVSKGAPPTALSSTDAARGPTSSGRGTAVTRDADGGPDRHQAPVRGVALFAAARVAPTPAEPVAMTSRPLARSRPSAPAGSRQGLHPASFSPSPGTVAQML